MTARAYLLAGFLFILLAMSGLLHAETIPATPETTTPTSGVFRSASTVSSYAGVPCTQITGGDYAPACAAHMGNYPITDNAWRYEGIQTACSASGVGVHEKQYAKSTGQFTTEYNVNYAWGSCANACPAGYTLSGGSCVKYSCPANQGWVLDGNSCSRTACQPGEARDANGQCKSDCSAGKKLQSGWYSDTNGDGQISSGCFSGCKGDFKGSGPTYVYWGAYQSTPGYVGDFLANGETCSGSSQLDQPSTPPTQLATDTPEYKCASQGMSWGTVNGQVLCLPSGTPSTPPTINPPETTKDNNPDGTRTETTVQDTQNGQTITRTTIIKTYDSNGNLTNTQTSSKSSPVGSFCEQNPDAQVCAESKTTGGGDCDTPPTSDGDAIQAAILKQTWETRCQVEKQNDETQQAKDWGNAQLDADQPANPLDNPEQKNVLTMFDQTNLLGTKACPAPKVIATPLGTWSIPFTEFCNLAAMIGHLILIFASFLSFRIVIGAL
jgi:hypothetical protein